MENQAMLSNFERSPWDPMHKPPEGKETFAIGITSEEELKKHRELNAKVMHDELSRQMSVRPR